MSAMDVIVIESDDDECEGQAAPATGQQAEQQAEQQPAADAQAPAAGLQAVGAAADAAAPSAAAAAQQQPGQQAYGIDDDSAILNTRTSEFECTICCDLLCDPVVGEWPSRSFKPPPMPCRWSRAT